MRFASLVAPLALTVLLSAAAPALADPDELTYVYYKIGQAPDATDNLYLREDVSPSQDYPGTTMVFMMLTRAGPRVKDGTFAIHIGGYVRCDDDTMAVTDHSLYDRTGSVTAGDDLDGGHPDFKPVDMDSQYGLVIKIACGQFDMKSLPTTGEVAVHDLITADTAAYDAKNGGAYAY